VKKTASLVLAFSIAFGAFAANASAATELETTVDKLIGIDYRYAGSTTNGFDCSGFTSYVFKKFGVDLPRRSADQATVGEKVAKADLRPGDLVFFNTDGKGISHVGIYMGEGKFAHASSSRGVSISNMDDSYYVNRYVTARRVLGTALYEKIATEAAPAPAQTASSPAATAEPAPAPTAPVATPAADEVAVNTELAELAQEQ